MKMTTTTRTVKHSCGHERAYDFAGTPPLLHSSVLSRLGERDCLTCRRDEHAQRHVDRMNSSSLLAQVAVETAIWVRETWERQDGMPKLEGTDEEFTQRFVVPARRRLDAAWWIGHCDPRDLDETLTRVDDASDHVDDIRGAR